MPSPCCQRACRHGSRSFDYRRKMRDCGMETPTLGARLLTAFAAVPDPRSPHGLHHPLPAILLLSPNTWSGRAQRTFQFGCCNVVIPVSRPPRATAPCRHSQHAPLSLARCDCARAPRHHPFLAPVAPQKPIHSMNWRAGQAGRSRSQRR